MTLHILFATPWSGSAHADCFRALQPGDALLLCGDGVYAALPRTTPATALTACAAEVSVYALTEDCATRGLATLAEGVSRLDYAGFVALAVAQPRSASWF